MDRSHLSRCLAKAIAYANVNKPDCVAFWLDMLCRSFGHSISDREAAERGRIDLETRGKL